MNILHLLQHLINLGVDGVKDKTSLRTQLSQFPSDRGAMSRTSLDMLQVCRALPRALASKGFCLLTHFCTPVRMESQAREGLKVSVDVT